MTAIESVDTSKLWLAFSNPVAHSQQAFRLILRAMSEPGERVCCGSLLANAPEINQSGIADASFITALTLLDQDTKIWLSPTMSQADFIANLRFHCGSPLVSSAAVADFVFMSVAEWSSLAGFKQGCEENPHHSATLIIQCAQQFADERENQNEDLQNSGLKTLTLSGPGIPGQRSVQLPGIIDKHLALLQQNYQIFPLGRDLLFTFGSYLMAIPRSTRLEIGGKSPGSAGLVEEVL